MFLKLLLEYIVYLPISKTLSYWWGVGRILSLIFVVQLLSGTILVMYYDYRLGFDSVQYIMYEVNWGWFMRVLHFNGARFFFGLLYLHLLKGLVFGGYRLKVVWLIGIINLMIFMLVGFVGYTLVGSQMRYWAAVVITSLLTIIPFWGDKLVYFVWGGFSVTKVTMGLFFVLHFLLPWLMVIMVILHVIVLHFNGRSSYLMGFDGCDIIIFYPYFWVKDFVGGLLLILVLFFRCAFPFVLGDTEIFIGYDVLISPVHIKPEWYFLFIYTILRVFILKVVGVVIMFFSVIIFGFCTLLEFNFLCYKVLWLGFVYIVCGLVWLGINLPELPYIRLGVLFVQVYFIVVLCVFIIDFFGKLLIE